MNSYIFDNFRSGCVVSPLYYYTHVLHVRALFFGHFFLSLHHRLFVHCVALVLFSRFGNSMQFICVCHSFLFGFFNLFIARYASCTLLFLIFLFAVCCVVFTQCSMVTLASAVAQVSRCAIFHTAIFLDLLNRLHSLKNAFFRRSRASHPCLTHTHKCHSLACLLLQKNILLFSLYYFRCTSDCFIALAKSLKNSNILVFHSPFFILTVLSLQADAKLLMQSDSQSQT